MPTYKTQGVVINTRNIGERDKLLTIFTKDDGKKTVIAKGIRRLGSRKAPYCDLLGHNTFLLARGRSLDIVIEAQPIHSLTALRTSLLSMAQVYVICELLHRFLADEQENVSAYQALEEIYLHASESQNFIGARHILLRFQVQLLSALGYLPELQECVVCRDELVPEGNTFSADRGGMVCASCSESDVFRGVPLSATTLKVIRFLERCSVQEVGLLTLSDHVQEESQAIFDLYIPWVLERRVNSTLFLRDVLNS